MNSSRDRKTLISEYPGAKFNTIIRLDHYIICFGGISNRIHDVGNTYTDTEQDHVIWRFNLYTEQWRKCLIPKTKQMPGPHTKRGSAVMIEGSVYLLLQSDLPKVNDFWRLIQTSHGCYAWEKVLVKHGTKMPSPRQYFSGWEYAMEMWIFGGVGSQLDDYLNNHGEHSGGNFGYNNQLLKFNPISKEWSNPRSSGAVPATGVMRYNIHTDAAIGHKFWYNSTAVFDELHELDMQSLVWTCIQFIDPLYPHHRSRCSLNALTEHQLVLHGGYLLDVGKRCTLSDTWILDLPSRSWKQYTNNEAYPRKAHCASVGLNNNIVIIGGSSGHAYHMHKDNFHVMLEPKCLLQLAMQTVFKYQSELPMKSLPRKLCKRMDIL